MCLSLSLVIHTLIIFLWCLIHLIEGNFIVILDAPTGYYMKLTYISDCYISILSPACLVIRWLQGPLPVNIKRNCVWSLKFSAAHQRGTCAWIHPPFVFGRMWWQISLLPCPVCCDSAALYLPIYMPGRPPIHLLYTNPILPKNFLQGHKNKIYF